MLQCCLRAWIQLGGRVPRLIFLKTKQDAFEQEGNEATTAARGYSNMTYCTQEKEEMFSHLNDIVVCKKRKVKPKLEL